MDISSYAKRCCVCHFGLHEHVLRWVDLVLSQERSRNMSSVISFSAEYYCSVSTLYKAADQNDIASSLICNAWRMMKLNLNGKHYADRFALLLFLWFITHSFSKRNSVDYLEHWKVVRTCAVSSRTGTVMQIGAFALITVVVCIESWACL